MMVDNGSTDGSVEAVRREFPAVEVLALGENHRFAGGNDEGLRRALAAGADAVMLVNNDTEADPGLFEHLVAALEADPGAGAAAPLICFSEPRERIWYAGGRCVPALGLAAHRGLRAYDHGQFAAVEETGYLTGCCLLARREAWEKVGLLDERYFIYAEDADWSLRARAADEDHPVAALHHPARATHRTIEEAETACRDLAREALGERRRDRAHLDDGGPGTRGGHDPVGAEDDGLDGSERRQKRAHNLTAGRDGRRGVRRLSAERLQRVAPFRDDVVADDPMPGGDQPRSNCVAEQAEADDAD
jgi:hypothetical protein